MDTMEKTMDSTPADRVIGSIRNALIEHMTTMQHRMSTTAGVEHEEFAFAYGGKCALYDLATTLLGASEASDLARAATTMARIVNEADSAASNGGGAHDDGEADDWLGITEDVLSRVENPDGTFDLTRVDLSGCVICTIEEWTEQIPYDADDVSYDAWITHEAITETIVRQQQARAHLHDAIAEKNEIIDVLHRTLEEIASTLGQVERTCSTARNVAELATTRGGGQHGR